MKRYPLAAGAAALIILLAACGSSGSPKTAPPTSGAIVISNSVYSGSMTVKPGQKVTVTNNDPMKHGLASTKTLFSTGTIEGNGGTETFTAPTLPGSYPIHCLFHTTMHGTLLVQD
jgi:plastocyanin